MINLGLYKFTNQHRGVVSVSISAVMINLGLNKFTNPHRGVVSGNGCQSLDNGCSSPEPVAR